MIIYHAIATKHFEQVTIPNDIFGPSVSTSCQSESEYFENKRDAEDFIRKHGNPVHFNHIYEIRVWGQGEYGK